MGTEWGVATIAACAVFWACAGLLVFTYAGYPLCMWLQSRWRPRPVARDNIAPTVTAILCAHDAGSLVRDKLGNLLALDYLADRLDVVVVCDGCSDDTAEAARSVDPSRVQVLEFRQRRGKAACLNDAVVAATGEVLLMVDVRQRIELSALQRLVACLADSAIGAAGGELRFEDPETGFAASVDAYWRYEKAIRHAESRSGSMVGVSGALYVIRRQLFSALPQTTVLDDVLVPMQVVRNGARVVFEPGAVAWDRASGSASQERRRKVRTLAGNLQLLQLAPWLVNPLANPVWFRFVSHKLLRIAAPWLLCALLVATAMLAAQHPFYLACLCAAVLAAVLLALTRLIPALGGFLPIRLLSTFWHMNLFAAQALIAYLRNNRLHLW